MIDTTKVFGCKQILVLAFFLSLSTNSYAQISQEISDEELVQAAVEDYVLGLYEVAPERIARSVDTTLHKIGYFDYDGEAYHHYPMTFQQLFELSNTWNEDGSEADENSPKEIEIYEVFDRTASAKLTAVWGTDFMHLSKVNGRWKIMNIMWQSQDK